MILFQHELDFPLQIGYMQFVFFSQIVKYFKHLNTKFDYYYVSGNLVVLWRRGNSVLTAKNIMVTRDSRFRLVDGLNLEISAIMPQDAGDYVCQISDIENKVQTHTVEVLGKSISFYQFYHNL